MTAGTLIATNPTSHDLHRITLFTLRRHTRRFTAEVVSADSRWELRRFAQEVMFVWIACATRDEASAYAHRIQDDFARDPGMVRRAACVPSDP